MTDIIRAALRKRPALPLVVCADLNLPPIAMAQLVMADVAAQLEAEQHAVEFEYQQAKERFPASMIVLTNYPHHYGRPDEPEPQCHTHVSTYQPVAPHHRATMEAIMHGLQTYGPIPSTWEEIG